MGIPRKWQKSLRQTLPTKGEMVLGSGARNDGVSYPRSVPAHRLSANARSNHGWPVSS